MAEELTPATIMRILARVDAEAQVKSRGALTATALFCETTAKTLLTRSSHRYGQPTASSPGSPPSLVSGTLRRSVTHTPVDRVAGMWESRVGPARGFFPPYPKKSRHGAPPRRTPSALYGQYLETGLRNGATYPWLTPAYRATLAAQPAIWKANFGGRW